MPTQKQYDTTLQRVRQIDCKIAVLDYDYTLLDEISGITTSIRLNVNADSDIRRTADISINLKDDISKNQNHAFYWTAGNSYWFNKYVQIYTSIKDIISGEDVWVNQGIYYVNAPSITYDAISNLLSFQAVDLVAKMTDMRNGQLEGMTYTVPVESSIKGAIEAILLEQGFTNYILYDPPQETTPEDVNIGADDSAWDLLTQLRDINSNWEMFFDVDGVFHFQQIPSGKVIIAESDAMYTDLLVTNESVNIQVSSGQDIEVLTEEQSSQEYGEPTPLVDDVIWDKALISATYDTDFDLVKNYIEVLGKVHEPNEFATTHVAQNLAQVTLSQPRDYYLGHNWTVEFGIQSDDTGSPVALANPIYYIYIYDSNVGNVPWAMIDITDDPITVGNEEYCIRMAVGSTSGDIKCAYLGYMQPKAFAIENNPESPFYIGKSTDYTCKLGTTVDFASNREATIIDVDATVTSNLAIIDVRPWISYNDYIAADLYHEWLFRVHVKLGDNNIPINTLGVKVAGTTVAGTIHGMSGQNISLDFSQDYMLVVARNQTTTPTIGMLYYPTDASNFPMSTTSYINMPKFTNQVRYVCSGGEYDNIYSNDLALQRARYEVYLRSRLHDSIDIVCAPIYWLDVNQVIAYRLPNSTSQKDDLWLVKSISTDISVDGKQTINAIRYYPEYAVI